MKKILCVLCVILVMAGCGTGRSGKAAPELMEPVGINVDTCTAEISDIINQTVQYGHMIPGTVKLYFETDGVIKNLPVYSGQQVKKGDLLVSLDFDDVQEQIERTEDQLEDLENLWEYDISLYNLNITYIQVEMNEIAAKQGTGSSAYGMKSVELQQAYMDRSHAQENHEAELSALETTLDELKKKVGQRELRAPKSGYIFFDDSVAEGTSVHDGGTIMYLQDPKDMRFAIDGYISEHDYDRFPVYAWINGKRFEVELIRPNEDELRAAQLAGETIRSEFKVKDPKGIECGDQGAIMMELLHVEDVLALPKNAILNDEGGRHVYVMQDDGTREKRYVETGRTNNVLTEIRSGLKEGETVYVPDK